MPAKQADDRRDADAHQTQPRHHRGAVPRDRIVGSGRRDEHRAGCDTPAPAPPNTMRADEQPHTTRKTTSLVTNCVVNTER